MYFLQQNFLSKPHSTNASAWSPPTSVMSHSTNPTFLPSTKPETKHLTKYFQQCFFNKTNNILVNKFNMICLKTEVSFRNMLFRQCFINVKLNYTFKRVSYNISFNWIFNDISFNHVSFTQVKLINVSLLHLFEQCLQYNLFQKMSHTVVFKQCLIQQCNVY